MFRTDLTIAPQERQLSRTARVLTVGSCFADSIGERLRLSKVQTLVNPFGTVFQPLALAQLLRVAAGEEQDWQQHLVEARGRWQSFDFHSTIGAESPVELLQLISSTVQRVGEFVRTADTVVLTLGTAWAYRLRETGELVSNLHKLPAGLFEKELLTADEIVNALAEVHSLLRRVNPSIRIVLTVSPVRHIKDTLPLNAVSKSVLRVACHYLSELLPEVSYFPAYELLTDELRDYRFYAADMLHPSEVAEDYIWDRFARTYFDADFGRFRKEWAAVRQSLGHRPLYVGAPEHRNFLDQTRERLERLATQGVDVRQELREVQRQLAALPPPRLVRVPHVQPEDDEERIDIGQVSVTEAVAPTPTQAADPEVTQPERRNDGRRNGRNGRRNERDGQNRPAETSSEVPATMREELLPTEAHQADELLEEMVAPTEELLAQPEAEMLATEEIAGYPAKKKKRRSRGGAKRTARKNAARLAAEQESNQTEPLAEAELAQETVGFMAEALLAELVVPATEAEPVEIPEIAEVTEAIETALTAGATPPAEAPAGPRKRGTGPTPKKSKVITKSGLVKRGQRTGLYRAQAPDAEEPSAALPEPASAPIISPPIIPEVLLERPTADVAMMLEPSSLVPSELPAVTTTLATPTPTTEPRPDETMNAGSKPKRGRPKAAAAKQNAPAPTTEEPAAGPAEVSAATPAKKTAARKSKPAAPKKASAKPAATRRGRPPGAKTPPSSTDTPAT